MIIILIIMSYLTFKILFYRALTREKAFTLPWILCCGHILHCAVIFCSIYYKDICTRLWMGTYNADIRIYVSQQ